MGRWGKNQSLDQGDLGDRGGFFSLFTFHFFTRWTWEIGEGSFHSSLFTLHFPCRLARPFAAVTERRERVVLPFWHTLC